MYYYISRIIDIIDIICAIGIICITLSACVSVLNPENVIDQMNDILVQHENLLHDSSFDRVAKIKCNWSGTC